MLRYQLNPHFLFNTLNSISTLVLLKQTERANAMLARLSSSFATRWPTSRPPGHAGPGGRDAEALPRIEKMRFEDRLRPHFKIESETIGARLPSLLLQPLIENAIKYAVTPAENGAESGLPRPARARRYGSRSPTMATATGANSLPARRPASAWRTFATGFRRPMARAHVSRPDRTSAGASALSSKFPMKPEKLPDDHPDHFGRRRTPCDARPAASGSRRIDDVEIVATAANGREAIRQIKTHKPDLVFLDIQMPGFDGFSVIQGLMDVEPPLFVFVTAYATTPCARSMRRRSTI